MVIIIIIFFINFINRPQTCIGQCLSYEIKCLFCLPQFTIG